MTEKTNELTVNVGTKINGKSPEEFTEQIDDLIRKLKEAKSLLNEIVSEMASIKIEIID